MFGPFYVGQVPLKPLTIKVVDETGASVDLASYSAITLLMFDPSNTQLDTSAGEIDVDAPSGIVTYTWDDTSLFTKVGAYSYQLRLAGNNGVVDYSRSADFKVLPLGRN